MKKRRCKCCKEYYPMDEMINPNIGWFKDFDHMARYGLDKSRKKAKQEHTRKKKELKDNDKSFQAEKAQTIFNKYVRLRDNGNVCISCQKPPRKKNAGHYLSRGAHPELRYHPLNCHLQCEHCNSFKSGNQTLYRSHLVEKIGHSNVDWLEGPHKPKRYTIDNLKTIQKWYKRKIKRLEKEINHA